MVSIFDRGHGNRDRSRNAVLTIALPGKAPVVAPPVVSYPSTSSFQNCRGDKMLTSATMPLLISGDDLIYSTVNGSRQDPQVVFVL